MGGEVKVSEEPDDFFGSDGVDYDGCFECGGDGWIVDDCFEDTCCCANPEEDHGLIPCPNCGGSQ